MVSYQPTSAKSAYQCVSKIYPSTGPSQFSCKRRKKKMIKDPTLQEIRSQIQNWTTSTGSIQPNENYFGQIGQEWDPQHRKSKTTRRHLRLFAAVSQFKSLPFWEANADKGKAQLKGTQMQTQIPWNCKGMGRVKHGKVKTHFFEKRHLAGPHCNTLKSMPFCRTCCFFCWSWPSTLVRSAARLLWVTHPINRASQHWSHPPNSVWQKIGIY